MRSQAYYNEIDPYAAEWLQSLQDAGEITPGEIDTRSIKDVTPTDVAGFRRVHFFAGIGGWELALQLAGWPDERPIWTGSCPCQPYSSAGKGLGQADERDLWPDMFQLIKAGRPEIVVGEQVASSDVVGTQLEGAFADAVQRSDFARANKLAKQLLRSSNFGWDQRWLDRIRADLEAEGYAFRVFVLGAHSVNSPHIRQRLYWAAHRSCSCERRGKGRHQDAQHDGHIVAAGRQAGSVEHANSDRPQPGSFSADAAGGNQRMGESGQPRSQGHSGDGYDGDQPGRIDSIEDVSIAQAGAWADYEWTYCRDGKYRRVPVPESGIQPLAYGLSRDVGHRLAGVFGVDSPAIRTARRNRVGRLRGYGNAIVPQVAAVFLRAVLEILDGDHCVIGGI